MSLPPIRQLASAYQVDPRQVSRWKTHGIDIYDPAQVLESLAGQRRPGKTLDRLLQPGELERTSQLIHNLFTTPKS
jgi:hypothetical protein